MANASNIPDNRSITKFVEALNQHDKVKIVSEDSDKYVLKIVLKSGIELRIRMTNIYCVGEADVVEFLKDDPNLNVIVTLSSWNQVTSEAAFYGRLRKIGVFTWTEFFGSLNYNKYWLYEAMPNGLDQAKANVERTRRRRAWN